MAEIDAIEEMDGYLETVFYKSPKTGKAYMVLLSEYADPKFFGGLALLSPFDDDFCRDDAVGYNHGVFRDSDREDEELNPYDLDFEIHDFGES